MAATLEEILLKVTGDVDPAERELATLAGELEAFDKIKADAEVEIDTLAARAELAALGRDMDVDRNVASQLGTELAGLGVDAAGAGGGFTTLGAKIGPLAGGLAPIAVIAAVLIPLFVVLAGAAAALAASFAAAVAGAAALAVGLGATLLPGIALGIGAVQRWKDTVDKAGSAAHTLKGAVDRVTGAFARAVAPGVDAVFRGIAAALRDIAPLLRELRPAFTVLGQTMGRIFRQLGEEFSNPAWRKFFDFLIRATARLAGPASKVFIQLARLFRDIARAALPYVIAGLRSLGRWLAGLREKAGGVEGIRDIIGTLVDHFRSWLNLARQVSRVVINFFSAAAPKGQSLVDWLAKGVKALADWLGRREGRQEVRRWFEKIVPAAKRFGETLWATFTAMLAFGEAAAPILEGTLSVINSIADALGPVIDALKWLGEHGFGGPIPLSNVVDEKPTGNAMGVRNFRGGMTWVGERGRELVNLPRGSDVYSAAESRRIAAGGGDHFHFHTSGGGPANPRHAMAQAARLLRERGQTA